MEARRREGGRRMRTTRLGELGEVRGKMGIQQSEQKYHSHNHVVTVKP